MEDCDISPDLDAYNIFWMVYPKIRTYIILIDGLCRAGRVGDAKHILLDQLLSKGLRPNVKIYTMIIGSHFLEGLDEEAEDLFFEMEKSGCVPDSKTYNVIVWMLLKRNEVYKAMSFLEEMYIRGFSADAANLMYRCYEIDYNEKVETIAYWK
ncbi:hypothetical protein ACS0TY_028205 [Phlomoides rotata]